MEILFQERREQGFHVIGVNTRSFNESAFTLERFLDQTQVTFDVVWDEGTIGWFGWPPAIAPFPRQAVVGRAGRIVYMASEHDAGAVEAAIDAALAE